MDEQDFVFLDKPLNAREEKEFSEFLKARKAKVAPRRKLRTTSRKKVTA